MRQNGMRCVLNRGMITSFLFLQDMPTALIEDSHMSLSVT